MPQLVTLRLALLDNDQNLLRRHPAIKLASAPHRAQEVWIFYDTARFQLQQDGIRLCLMRRGGGWVQRVSVRTAEKSGLASFPFWESAYWDHFDFSAVEATDIREKLQQSKWVNNLKAISESNFRRSSWILDRPNDTRITIKLDRGWIAAAGRRIPISELVLELERGDTEELYTVAMELATRVPLYPEQTSKAVRGYRLHLDLKLEPVKAGRLQLDTRMTPLTAFRAVALDCLSHLHANHQGAVTSEDPEYIHQMRVATRRLRAAMRVFKPVLPAEFSETLLPPLRELMSVLGRARDLDVLISEVISPVCQALPGEPRLADLLAVVTDRLYGARRDSVIFLRQSIYSMLHLKSGLVLNSSPFLDTPERVEATVATPTDANVSAAQSLIEFSELRLRKLLKTTRVLATLAHADDPPSLHALRISIKRLRYAIEFFGTLLPRNAGMQTIRRLADLQDELGQLNDLANAGAILMACAGKDPQLREAVTLIGGWHSERHAGLLAAIPRQLIEIGTLKLPQFRSR